MLAPTHGLTPDPGQGCVGLFSMPMANPHPWIYNDNRSEWSPIWSEIIRVINKIGRPRSGSPICFASMITDQIGRHLKVLLPINHNHYNF